MGWIVLVVAGAALWWWSLALALRAYRGERMPLWATPTKAPGRAVVLRAAGTGLAVFGTAMASPALTASAPAASVVAMATLIVLLLAPYVVGVAIHNRRVRLPE
ncbi:hypothetical protein [Microbacterium sp. 5K110]|jgi:hypothetical protein|uniref:hypothetical protein n=1 Tax=unclassified Microbacterium TaxID=2609290 RepID=UPI0010FE007B|nr:hypothetical protein [Microbacterium sp. 5K110]TLF29764.1 hypothetical protein FE256_12100 [Microbacterium sp. 5K110]